MFLSYSLENETRGTANVLASRRSFVFQSPCLNKNDCTPYVVNLKPGKYKIEAWGSGGQNDIRSGLGAYAKGEIFFEDPTVLFIYIGSKSSFNNIEGLPKVGSYGCGSSDVRITGGEWYDFDSQKSRILVAGGGGGREWTGSIGGNAGALVGETGYGANTTTDSFYDPLCFANGGTQTSSGTAAEYMFRNLVRAKGITGGFGYGGFDTFTNDNGGIGGGGYYGGASMNYAGGGGGGSSYISGHYGCDAIFENSTKDNITHTHQSVHYSGHIFRKTIMIPGNFSMPSYSSPTANIIGNQNSGAVRISYLPISITCMQNKPILRYPLAVFLITALS